MNYKINLNALIMPGNAPCIALYNLMNNFNHS